MRIWLGLLLATSLSWAGGPAVWESNSFADFLKGRLHSVALTRDGRLTLAPALTELAVPGEAAVWSVVSSKDGTLYFSTGHSGRVYSLKPGGQPALLWTAPQSQVFALALDAQGRLYAGTSPNGRIYRIENDKVSDYFDPKAAYIWALAVASDGSLFAATGDQGRLFRITAPNTGEVWYETGQTHLTALAFDAKGNILAGSEPNGLVYRVEAKDKAFLLYDAGLPEIRNLVPAPDGSIYVAALGGGLAQKQAAAQASTNPAGQTPVVTTSITVSASDSSTQAGMEIKPKAEAAKPQSGAEPPPAAVPVESAGGDKSAIFRIWPDGLVETIWSSREENVYALALREKDLYFGTDARGRIYRLGQDLKATLVVETKEGEATRLLPTAQGLIAATSNQGRLVLINDKPVAQGRYESAVHDTAASARWGHLEFKGVGPVSFQTRSGNSMRPDKTWSTWTKLGPEGVIASPTARYIQWQAELTAGAQVDSVLVNYQAMNSRPVVRSLQVTPQWMPVAQKTPAQPTTPIAYSATVTDGDGTGASSITQTVLRSGTPQLWIAWQGDDPDGDKLVYSIYYRAEDEETWKLLKADLTENGFMQEAEVLADGRYYFRVVASDRLANSASLAREGELISQPVLVDQTPPQVKLVVAKGNPTRITVEAVDGLSPVRRAEYSVNGGPWKTLDAADGIADSKTERFEIQIGAGGEQSVVVRAFDAAGNAGLARTVLR